MVHIISDIGALYDCKWASILSSACLISHEDMIFLLDIFCHFFDVGLVFLSASNLQWWLNKLDHGLKNEVLDCCKVPLLIIDSFVLELFLHLFSDEFEALISLFHLQQFRWEDLLWPHDIEIKLNLLQSSILIFLALLPSNKDHVLLLCLKASLCKHLYLESFLVCVLSKHSLHFEWALPESDVRALSISAVHIADFNIFN